MDGWQHAADYVDMYTPEFRRDVARRYRAADSPGDLAVFLDSRGMADLDAFTSERANGQPVRPLPQALAAGRQP